MKKNIIVITLLLINATIFTAQPKITLASPQQLATIKAYNPFDKAIVPAARLIGQVAFEAVKNQKISREEIEGTGYFLFFGNKNLKPGEVVIIPRGDNTFTFGVILIAGNNKSTIQVNAKDVKLDLLNTWIGQILYEQKFDEKPLIIEGYKGQAAVAAAAKK